MGLERNPNFPCGVIMHDNGEIDVYFSGHEPLPLMSRFAQKVEAIRNGHGEETIISVDPNAPIAVWEEPRGAVLYEYRLYPGRHDKTEEPFQSFPIIECDHDNQIGEYTMVGSIAKPKK